MKKYLLLSLFSCSFIFSIAQPVAFTGCPANNVAILRAGNNNSTANPISIYNVNTATGAVTFLSGPIADPANATSNLQVNGLGLNGADGFLYGLEANPVSILSTNIALPFYRIGANAVAIQAGNVPGPARAPGETQSFAVPAAGEMDQSGNYYFTGATGILDNTSFSFTVKRLFLGKLPAVSSLAASATAILSPTYVPITSNDINCAAYLATLTATYTVANAAAASNTGIKDLVFDKSSGQFYTYVTYPEPANASNFAGLMLQLDPATGLLTAVAPPVTLPFASASNEVAGTLLDQNGNFLILFTNGSMYKANTSASGVFDGSITLLNGTTGLPSPLRGDMASCGGGTTPIVPPTTFTGCPDNNVAVLRAGNNSGTGPVSIYNVNTTTGLPTLLSGPILDPAGTGNNLQVNGLGLNPADGFLYGLNASTTSILTINTALPFYRVGANAVAVQTGNMPGPARTGSETQSFVNPAAGEMDKLGNYYFTGTTGTLSPASFQVNRLFIGVLPAVSSLPASTSAVLTPSYQLITSSDPNCAAFLATVTASFSLANAANAGNTGLKDLVYDNSTGYLYSYVTYPDPANTANYAGLMIKLDPVTGVLTAVAPPVVLPFVSANNEVAGTLLDKDGNFLILFTNGSMYKANTSAPGVFDGSIALLNGATGLPSILRGDMASCGGETGVVPPVPFTRCPTINVAIVRAGTNASVTNPLSIYSVNSVTGMPTLLSGPILDPADATKNLQVNGLGLNSVDGFLYGLKASTVSIATINNPLPFYRVGANAIALQMGNMPGPAAGAGETHSFVVPAAGEMDQSDNYYFTGATATLDNMALSFTVKRLFLGKLSSVSMVSASTVSVLAPTYTPITSADVNCTDFLATLTASYTLANATAASNTGIKDLVSDKNSGKLYTYVTYPDPANVANFLGLMLAINPVTGDLTAVAPPVVLPFVSAANEVAGQLLDQQGNYLVLFTNGTIYKANKSAPGVFDGSITALNTSTGLPSPLRGDMASCGGAAAALLPVVLNYFNVYSQDNTAVLQWETATEQNTAMFLVERSADGINWTVIKTVPAAGNTTAAIQYRYEDKNVPGGAAFYRLRMVDENGLAKYSAIKKLLFNAAGIVLTYYPNPVKDILYAESTKAFSSNMHVSVTNVSGKMYNTIFKKSGANRISIDLSALPAGMYFIQLSDGVANNTVQKIIKQ